MKIVWSPLALERVEEIAAYIARDNPDAAVRWVEELFDRVDQLNAYPASGRVVPEIGVSRIREIAHGAYRVLYSVSTKVEILTVRRGSQILRDHDVGE
ncbi:MAG: type II toxin-antitoxin system RelE/ParE family toxin [Candidatus Hydrogenedentes bacterium]|nr:type II toxin-antitoxin system RelE/ParE family toxin [Candidatus Hydrogenedentota bacterium]